MVEELQDLGELTQTIRKEDDVGPSGVNVLVPDEAEEHADAISEIRSIIDEHYGDTLDRLSGEGERVVIERLVVQSDDLPHIEYRLVTDRDDE